MAHRPEVILAVAAATALAIAFLARMESSDIQNARDIGLIFLGPIGAWFVYQRNRTYDRQADTAEANLRQAEKRTVNDSFVKAIELLGARDKNDGPAIELRLGAIYALERLARDNPDYHIQIMETLCAYVRDHAPARPADLFPGTVLRQIEREHPGLSAKEIGRDPRFQEAAERLSLSVTALRNGRNEFGADPCLDAWLATCEPPRADIRAILDVIGQRTASQRLAEAGGSRADDPMRYDGYRLDLRGTHLRLATPGGKGFAYARLDGAQLEGARLEEVCLTGATLDGAHLEGAILSGALLTDARAHRAEMERTDLGKARIEGTDFNTARMPRADFSWAQLRRVSFRNAQMQAVHLSDAQLERVDFRDAEMAHADLSAAYLNRADFGRAQLSDANFETSLLTGDRRDLVDFSSAVLNLSKAAGAAVRFVDFSGARMNAHILSNTFGDASVTLPVGLIAPFHWADRILEDEEFFARWRGWLEVSPTQLHWQHIAPDRWKDIPPAPPPAGLNWE